MQKEKINDLILIYKRYQSICESKHEIAQKNKELGLLFHFTLEQVCDIPHVRFTTLFARIAYLNNLIEISPRQVFILQSFRRLHENQNADDDTIYAFATYSLEILFHYFLDNPLKEIPKELITNSNSVTEYQSSCYGLIFSKADEFYFIHEESQIDPWKIIFEDERYKQQISRLLEFRLVFLPATLISAKMTEEIKEIRFGSLVLMPNYLLDVTSIAESFKPNGKLPQAFLIKKFVSPQKKLSLLQGNVANHILDTLIYSRETSFKEIMSQIFQQDPLAYLAFDDEQIRSFINDSKKHYKNILNVLDYQLGAFGIDIKSTYTEPTFLSNIYGIQGRLDVLHQSKDRRRNNIIELKSGSAYRPNTYGLSVNHYTQTLLYDLMISSSMGNKVQVSNYILYSKLDKDHLRFAPKATALQFEALSLRNDLVYIDTILQHIDEEKAFLIFKNMLLAKSNAIDKFIQIDLNQFIEKLKQLTPLEINYFRSFVSFIAREHLLAKTGTHGIEKSNGFAGLWLDSLEEKQEQFRILSLLSIKENKSDQFDPIIKLVKTDKSNKLSRFRKGDIAVLYPWQKNQNSPLKNQIFKTTIIDINEDEIVVRLRNPQFNQSLFEEYTYWNLEGDLLDSGFIQLFKNIFDWMKMDERVRSMYLGLEQPQTRVGQLQSIKFQNVTEEQGDVLIKIINAQDYFLLWGPPGTGKTSVIIRELVRHYKSINAPILLLSYTNRSVDEICSAIESVDKENDIPYVRIGSKYACDPRYQERLLQKQSEKCVNRESLRNFIYENQIFVSTVSSMYGKKELFKIKQFETIIIDEASQLLEPAILGVLNKAKKIIMIGDHKQLPAVVQQNDDNAKCKFEDLHKQSGLQNLDDSLFERLISTCRKKSWDENFASLTKQGRMHEKIVAFPSQQFYQNELTPLDGMDRLFFNPRSGSSFMEFVFSSRVIFIDTPIDDQITHKTNDHEAEIVKDLLSLFYSDGNGKSSSDQKMNVGVITPYRAQIALIDEKIASSEIPKSETTIDTVERYQGSARDHIIFSMCINGTTYLSKQSSLKEPGIDKKFNVAITRSRESLIIVGNKKALSQNNLYKAWIDQATPLSIESIKMFKEQQS